jgi:hypothetical protein
MTERLFEENETRGLVLEEVRADLKADYKEAVKAGKSNLVEVKPPALIVEENGKSLTVKTQEMTPAQENVALENIDADLAQIRKERNTLFPGELPYQLKKGRIRVGKGYFAEFKDCLRIRKFIVPQEEQEASIERLTCTLGNYASACHDVDVPYGVIFLLPYQKGVLSEEWETLQDFRELGRDSDKYVQANKKFHNFLEYVDQLIDIKYARSALEILAVMRRINNDRGEVDEKGKPVASVHFEGKYDMHMYYAARKIYKAFLENPEDFHRLTPWQYEALVDAATQYEWDKAEDAEAQKHQRKDIAALAKSNEILEETSKRAEEKRKTREAHQAIFNCITAHYLKKAKESVSNV